jgi:hypothetical protein
MQKHTLSVIEAIMETDGTISPAERKRLVGAVQSGSDGERKPDRILRRKEAAWMLGRCAKTIDRLVGKGCIGRVTFPGHKRAAGLRLSDVERLISGGTEE